MNQACVEQGLVGHEKALRAPRCSRNRRLEMGKDALTPHRHGRQLLPHGRIPVLHGGLATVEEIRADHLVCKKEHPRDIRKGAVSVQGIPDMGGSTRVPTEQHVLPWHKHIVEDQPGVDFVKPGRDGIVLRRPMFRESAPADVLQARGAHVANETERMVGELLVPPIGDGRNYEGLVCVCRHCLILGAAHHDSRIRLPNHAKQHVRILLLRPPGPITLGIGVGRNVKEILPHNTLEMTGDILQEAPINLVQQIGTVVQGPHFADGLVANANRDSTRRRMTASTQAALSCQSCRSRGKVKDMAFHAPAPASRRAMTLQNAFSRAMS